MNKIFEIQNNKVISPSFRQDSDFVEKKIKTPDIPDDTFISEKKQETSKNSQQKTAISAIGLTIIGLGGILLSKHLYKNAQNKLANGIKKGEIREEFFNFIKKNDPNCEYFNNKTNILQLEKDMDEEKFLILKKLYRMNDLHKNSSKKRFNFKEIDTLLKITDKNNIEFLELLANKQYKPEQGDIKKLSPQEIKNILLEINAGNKEVAQSVIEKYNLENLHIGETEKVQKLLKSINKDNVEIYKLLFASRKDGKNTALKYDELKDIANLIKEKNNPKTAEIILNLKETNGSNKFVYTPEKIKKILKVANDENIQTYEKILKDENIANLNKLDRVLPSINESNYLEFIKFSKLKSDDSIFIFSDSKTILDLTNKTLNLSQENHELLDRVLTQCKLRRIDDREIIKLVDYLSKGDKNLENKIERELDKGNDSLFSLLLNIRW